MSSLSDTAAELLDRLCAVVSNHVVGTIAVTTLGERVLVPRGTYATIPDGRRLRVTHNTWVDLTGTVPVRLEFLTPHAPRKANFAQVALGTVATFVDPPAGIETTGTTSEFAAGSLASDMKIGAIAEHDSPDAYPADASGTAALILVSPNLRNAGTPALRDSAIYEATWPLRLNLNDNAEQPVRRTRARDAIDAVCASVVGTWAGDDIVTIGSWTKVRDGQAWDGSLVTRVSIDGAPLRSVGDDLDGSDLTVTLPEDEDQPTPFRVEDSTLFEV